MNDDNPFQASGTEAVVITERQRLLHQTRATVWASAVLLIVPGAALLASGVAAAAYGTAEWWGFAAGLLGLMTLGVVTQLMRFAVAIGRVISDPAPMQWARMFRAERNAWLIASILPAFGMAGLAIRMLGG